MFFIEHGLNQDELDALTNAIRDEVRLHPVGDVWWDSRSLPLIVVATENGYRYRGAGTDFWPLLADELKTGLEPSARQHIRHLFEIAAGLYRGARPTQTPWASAFHLIAWPITHALVPLEFHRPLAATLASLHTHVTRLDDAALYHALRVATPRPTARFATLLEDSHLMVAVTRSLLDEASNQPSASNQLSAAAMERLRTDLASDRIAWRDVAVARRLQRTATRSGPTRRVEAPNASPSRGLLQLRRAAEGGLSLEAAFPTLPEPAATGVRRSLRQRRYAPQLWGVARRLPIAQVLSGVPFGLEVTSIPRADAHLFPGLDALGLDPTDAAFLGELELRMTPPLLFAVTGEGDLGRVIRADEVSGHHTYWALLDASKPWSSGGRRLGRLGPYDCYEFPQGDAASEGALSALGFRVRFGVSVRFSGAPAIDRGTAVPAFLRGDQRVITPRRLPAGGELVVELGGASTRAKADEVVRVTVPRGAHTLRISIGAEGRDFAFHGLTDGPLPPRSCSVELRSSERTVQALLSGRLAFAVESFAPLEGLAATLAIEIDGRRVSATAPLGPLPVSITAEHELLKCLLDEPTTRESLAQASNTTVHLRLGHLCSASWELERQVRPCWWEIRGRHPALVSELGPLHFGEVAAEAPHLRPSEQATTGAGTRLLAPIGLDSVEFGGSAGFTTMCVAPDRARLESPAIRKPRLLRRRRGDRADVGLEDLVEAYLRWSLAETRSIVAELRRRQTTDHLDAWVAEVCCGETWALREGSLRPGGPWTLFAEVCDKKGLGRDPLIVLSRSDEEAVTRLAINEIRRFLPDLWARVGPPSELGPDDYEALDLACGRGYGELARRRRLCGQGDLAAELDDADPGNAEEAWAAALAQVVAQAELRPLAELLLPSDTASKLMSLDVSAMSLDDVVGALAAWANTAYTQRALAGAAPTIPTLKAIFALWAEPEAAVRLDWRGALDVMVAERSVCRAARYLALQARAARLGGGA